MYHQFVVVRPFNKSPVRRCRKRHPPFVRMEGRSIPPLGSKTASYKVPAKLLTKPGKYRLSVRMRITVI